MKDSDSTKVDRRKKLVEAIRKVEIFSDIDNEQAQYLLSLCSKVTVGQNDFLCRKGDETERMFILIKGEMIVKLNNSTVISTIRPVNPIGEIGVFTGESRTADVVATEESLLITIKKSDIDSIIENAPELGIKIMRRVIKTLSGRLIEDNRRIREFQNYIMNQ